MLWLRDVDLLYSLSSLTCRRTPIWSDKKAATNFGSILELNWVSLGPNFDTADLKGKNRDFIFNTTYLHDGESINVVKDLLTIDALHALETNSDCSVISFDFAIQQVHDQAWKSFDQSRADIERNTALSEREKETKLQDNLIHRQSILKFRRNAIIGNEALYRFAVELVGKSRLREYDIPDRPQKRKQDVTATEDDRLPRRPRLDE